MSGKILVRAKMTEKVLKWPKKRLFRLFLEISSLDFPEIWHIVRKYYSPHFGENHMSGKILVRAKMPKKGDSDEAEVIIYEDPPEAAPAHGQGDRGSVWWGGRDGGRRSMRMSR